MSSPIKLNLLHPEVLGKLSAFQDLRRIEMRADVTTPCPKCRERIIECECSAKLAKEILIWAMLEGG